MIATLFVVWLSGLAMGYAFADIRLQLEERRACTAALRQKEGKA